MVSGQAAALRMTSVLGRCGKKATATTEADPYEMTNKRANNSKSKDKSDSTSNNRR
jgi:hypothetical protein